MNMAVMVRGMGLAAVGTSSVFYYAIYIDNFVNFAFVDQPVQNSVNRNTVAQIAYDFLYIGMRQGVIRFFD